MAEKKDKAEGGGKSELTPQQNAKRSQDKSRWTLDLCKKYAKRFHSVEDWQRGAPSCYKAAAARGWLKECSAVMAPAPAKSGKAAVGKVAARSGKAKTGKVG